jgi:signal transduction histidine kinase
MSSPDEQDRSRAETYAEFAALVGGLAHEIRNPLSTIRLNMELLAEDFENTDPDSPTKQRDRRAKAKIDLVRQECDRLQKLLGDFLDFARQESLTLEPGSLNAEIEQLLDFFSIRATEAGVEIVRYLDPELPAVRLDRETFRSAVLNLLLNAAQAIAPGATTPARIWTNRSVPPARMRPAPFAAAMMATASSMLAGAEYRVCCMSSSLTVDGPPRPPAFGP